MTAPVLPPLILRVLDVVPHRSSYPTHGRSAHKPGTLSQRDHGGCLHDFSRCAILSPALIWAEFRLPHRQIKLSTYYHIPELVSVSFVFLPLPALLSAI